MDLKLFKAAVKWMSMNGEVFTHLDQQYPESPSEQWSYFRWLQVWY